MHKKLVHLETAEFQNGLYKINYAVDFKGASKIYYKWYSSILITMTLRKDFAGLSAK
jgi:hypothetical protein